MTIKELRQMTGLTQTAFGQFCFGIPLRTVQDWEAGKRKPPDWVVKLIEYRIDKAQVE